VISGGKGHDVMAGGAGRDRILAKDGQRDVITCGAGDDHVRADRSDSVSGDCEHVARS
jgi:Ca2+-binding RTX toxin-like protein